MTHVHKDSNAPAVDYENRGTAMGTNDKSLVWVWNFNVCDECSTIFNRTYVRSEVQ